jgi:hypothetical protein
MYKSPPPTPHTFVCQVGAEPAYLTCVFWSHLPDQVVNQCRAHGVNHLSNGWGAQVCDNLQQPAAAAEAAAAA